MTLIDKQTFIATRITRNCDNFTHLAFVRTTFLRVTDTVCVFADVWSGSLLIQVRSPILFFAAEKWRKQSKLWVKHWHTRGDVFWRDIASAMAQRFDMDNWKM